MSAVLKAGKSNSKGISPLVAAVLLIAVTMTIAGVLAMWATSFVRSSLPQQNETEMECRFADFSIYSCTHTNSTVNLILENMRDIEMRDLQAYFIYGNNTVSDVIYLNETLPAGRLRSYTITDVGSIFSKISIKGQCPDLKKEKACVNG